MLKIKDITKVYSIGNQDAYALDKINLSFREKEFVSILGQSGSGKTTLLNIIGGLDQYTSGDLIIDGVSTKEYKDKDWDAYRNHRIGFVFQNYNLITHLSVLSNVELALTLSGVSSSERKKKAEEVLIKVGLKDHLYKKPNQLSGGQQQRVAIARALVNDPSIILADEPTGALDSETSVEIMEILKEISHDKLIIMVTHNPVLAKKYSNRVVELLDGKVLSDTNPYEIKEKKNKNSTKEKTSMSFFTALRLSFTNLLTKKVRTFITAFAGSIGIIGVALVLSLQYGFNNYLKKMETDIFAGLPIEVNSSYINFGSAMEPNKPEIIDENGLSGYDPQNSMGRETNNITPEYINYLENSTIKEHATIVYTYGFVGQYYYFDGTTLHSKPTSSSLLSTTNYIKQSPFSIEFINEYFQPVNQTTAGRLYDNSKNEALLFVDQYNRVPNAILEFLGFKKDSDGQINISFDQIVGKKFKVYTNNAYFKLDTNSNRYISNTNEELLNNYTHQDVIEVEIVGVVKSTSNLISSSPQIVYSDAVTTALMDKNAHSQAFLAQNQSEEIIILDPEYGNSKTKKEEVLKALGGVKTPSDILLYPNSYDSKEAIVTILDQYNVGLDKEDQINYTDTIATALSMIKTIMNSVSIVLIAFSAISLVVSSVMIGIITYTSVLERTKEIGVLRSIGARKKDISRVFNAETIIVGFLAGTLGVLITYLLNPIISKILEGLMEASNVAQLYYVQAVILIIISIGLTFIAGLIPSRIAAKKDPVVALRTE